ncbi:hypothetical protein BH24CHL1_BH24CHL1_16930 [soil metagenome]
MHRFGLTALILAAALIITPFVLTRQTQAQPAYADDAFETTRDRLDKPVEDEQTSRTWFWGPEPISEGILESYVESPGGERLVQYMDKAQLELTQPDTSSDDAWFVSTGLLTRELISGSIQTGDSSYEEHEPSETAMAGDASNTWPTYAGFARVIDQMYVDDTGNAATNALLPGGVTSYPEAESDPNAEIVQYITYDGPDGPAGYNVPAAFWEFMNASGVVWDGTAFVQAEPLMDWLFVMGYPISDPFWASVQLDAKPTWVLIQAFERRVLTYTPSNPEGWQVEMGNVGRHYMEWRDTDGDPDNGGVVEPTPTTPPPVPTPPVTGGTGPATDFFAMQIGNSWTYEDRDTGNLHEVDIIGRSAEFIDGEWLRVRRELFPDGAYELTYWEHTDTVLWLYGREEYSAEGNLEDSFIYDPPIRYIVNTLDSGQGWGSNSWVERNGERVRLVQFAFEVTFTRTISVPAGQFETSFIQATETRTDGDNLIGPTTIVSEFDFTPFYGVVRDNRGDDGPLLDLVSYELQ